MAETGSRAEARTASSDMEWFAERFEEHRPRLRAVAYRMLGSVTEAEDALQEAWIRTTRSDSTAIDNIDGWLVTLVGRVCVDMLRRRRSRREQPSTGWLPEPVVSTEDELNPEQASLLADSVGLALLVILEYLEPEERLSFVLHDMFGVPFAEIAPIVGRTPVAARQLASRARRRVRGTATVPNADLPTQRKIVAAFLAASRAGDFEALIRLLDPDIVFRVDTGTRTWLAPAILSGAVEVAGHAAAQGPRFATLCRPALVNGAAGVVAMRGDRLLAAVGVTVIDGLIAEIDLVLDRNKLTGLVIADS